MKTLATTSSEMSTVDRQGVRHAPAPLSRPVFAVPGGIPLIQRKNICACDGGCPRCSGVIQPKLTIGAPNDKYEQEADRVADQVMRMPEPAIQRSAGCSSCGDLDEDQIQTKSLGDQITPLVQRQEDAGIEEEPEEEEEEEPVQPKGISNKSPPVTTGLRYRIQSMKGGGQPLSASTRAFFEPRFGYDFSRVRVFTDSHAAGLARHLNAKAFTRGNNIVFGTGQYSSATSPGKHLLAHELTHVVQQAHASRKLLQRKAEHPQIAGKNNERQVILPAKPRGKEQVRGIVRRWFEPCPCRKLDYTLSGIFSNPDIGNLAIAYRVCRGRNMADFYARLQSNARAFLEGKAPPLGTARVGINVVLQGKRVAGKVVLEAIGTNKVASGAIGGRAQVIFQGNKWVVYLDTTFLHRLKSLPGGAPPNRLDISLGARFGNLKVQVKLSNLLAPTGRTGRGTLCIPLTGGLDFCLWVRGSSREFAGGPLIRTPLPWGKKVEKPKCYHCFCPPAVRKYECMEDTLPREEKIKKKVAVPYRKQYRYYFRLDKTEPSEERSLRNKSNANLSALAAEVKAGGIVVSIYGYASPEAKEKGHNDDLSMRRAIKMKKLIRARVGKGVTLPEPLGMGELLGHTPTTAPSSRLADIARPGRLFHKAEEQLLFGREISNKELRTEFILLFKKLKTPGERLALFGLTEKDPLAKRVLNKIKRFMRSRRGAYRPWEGIFRLLRISIATVKKVKMEDRFESIHYRGNVKRIPVSDPRCKVYIKEAEKTGKFGKEHPDVLKPSASAEDNYVDCLSKPKPMDLKKGCKYELTENFRRVLRGPFFAPKRLR